MFFIRSIYSLIIIQISKYNILGNKKVDNVDNGFGRSAIIIIIIQDEFKHFKVQASYLICSMICGGWVSNYLCFIDC